MQQWMKPTGIFCLIVVPIMGMCMLFIISGRVAMSYQGFSLDSSERLYVGKNTGIEVYENGNKIRTISAPSSRSYAFTVSNDRIVASVGDTINIMNLEGKLIEQQPDNYAAFNEMKRNSSKFVTSSGKQYSKTNICGYYKIVRNDGVCVYSMPLLDYIVNVVIYACGLSTLVFVVAMLVKLKIIKIGKKGFSISK